MITNLHTIPHHMREAVIDWVERAEPHPDGMGSFFWSLLVKDFFEACCRADEMNALCMRQWALFLYNDVPSECWGSPAKLVAWYDKHHPPKVQA
jgi:hypothetical protein